MEGWTLTRRAGLTKSVVQPLRGMGIVDQIALGSSSCLRNEKKKKKCIKMPGV